MNDAEPIERGSWHREAMWMRKNGALLKQIAAHFGVSIKAVSLALSPEAAARKREYDRLYMRARRKKQESDHPCY